MNNLKLKNDDTSIGVKVYFVSWKSEYSINVNEIDNQHKEVLNFINYIFSKSSNDKEVERKYFNRVMNSGIKELMYHFSCEEEIMIKTKYPKYEEHKIEHEKLLTTVSELVRQIESGEAELNLFSIAEFLRDWVLSHIPAHDNPAAEYFKIGISEDLINS
jgi:hemerythrin